MALFKGSMIDLAIGSNVALPMFSCKRLNSIPVWETSADKDWFNLAVAWSASLVAPVETFKAWPYVDWFLPKSLKTADKILAWKTPATCSRKYP